MKGPKILRYSWEDLTGLEELDSDEMEELRLMFRGMEAAGLENGKNVLINFFTEQATYILLKPTSDLSVVLFRLLLPEARETLNITAFTIQDENFSFGQFVDLVTDSFFFAKRPVPIVSGIPPRIWL